MFVDFFCNQIIHVDLSIFYVLITEFRVRQRDIGPNVQHETTHYSFNFGNTQSDTNEVYFNSVSFVQVTTCWS